MFHSRLFERLIHLPRRIVRELLGYLQLAPLPLVNRYGSTPVTQPGGPVVSLTTYGRRAQTVYLAIESIARGEVRPSRLILWVDEVHLLNNLPATLRRLQKRGLEVRLCENYGSHKKYYPYVESQSLFDCPLATADDDIIYPRYWLRRLVDEYREHPNVVNCYFAGTIQFEKTTRAIHMDGKSCNSTVPNILFHSIGMDGVIYPPQMLGALKAAGLAFTNLCPKNSDVWLNVTALRSGFMTRQILQLPPYLSFQAIPGTQRCALLGAETDESARECYAADEIERLYAEYRSMPPGSRMRPTTV